MIRPLFCAAMLISVAALPAMAQEGPPAGLDKQAIKMFQATYAEACDWAMSDGQPLSTKMEKFEFVYLPSYDPQGQQLRIEVYRFFCAQGAYNAQHVYFWWREYDGLQPLVFAVPTYLTKFENDDSENGKLLSIDVTGFATQSVMVNSEVDLGTATITDNSLWRGPGDASSRGIWTLDDGQFRLANYQVDPSYNGQIDPVTIVEYSMP